MHTCCVSSVTSPDACACANSMISMFPDSALSFQLKYPVGKSGYSRSTPWFSKKLGEVLVDGNDIPDLGFSGPETLGGKVHRAVPMSCAANGRFCSASWATSNGASAAPHNDEFKYSRVGNAAYKCSTGLTRLDDRQPAIRYPQGYIDTYCAP